MLFAHLKRILRLGRWNHSPIGWHSPCVSRAGRCRPVVVSGSPEELDEEGWALRRELVDRQVPHLLTGLNELTIIRRVEIKKSPTRCKVLNESLANGIGAFRLLSGDLRQEAAEPQ